MIHIQKIKIKYMGWDEIDKIHLWGETNAFYLFFEPKLGWSLEGCILLFDYNTNEVRVNEII